MKQKIFCRYCWALLAILLVQPAFSQGLDLTTGSAVVQSDQAVSLKHLAVDDRFYDAVIQLNLDGTYQILSAQEVFLPESVQYQVTFESFWSAETHPYEFPGASAHFSGLIGATHKSDYKMWQTGALASPGIENMAETGGKSPLRNEIMDAIAAGDAEVILSGDGLGNSPSSVSLTFEASRQFPFVSLVSMIAPSPDWFVGVSGVNLIRNGQWLDELSVTLFAYDSGTDNGDAYFSANSDTVPKQPVSRLEVLPFLVNDRVEPIGRLVFQRL